MGMRDENAGTMRTQIHPQEKKMTTTSAVDKSQTERAIERTEKLLDELKRASDIVETKDAIMNYVSDIDCCSDYQGNPFVLGDADFAHLFVQSLERRGKTPIERWAPMIISGAQVEYSLFKPLLRSLRKGRKKTSRNSNRNGEGD